MKTFIIIPIVIILIACNNDNNILNNTDSNNTYKENAISNSDDLTQQLLGNWNAIHGTGGGIYEPEWPADSIQLRPPYILLFFYEQGFDLRNDHLWYPRRYDLNDHIFSTDTLYWGDWQVVDPNTLLFTTNMFSPDTIEVEIIKFSLDSLTIYSTSWGTAYLVRHLVDSIPACSNNNLSD